MGILKKKIILAGRAASGKSTLKDALVEAWDLTPEISYTTRAPRPGEVNGKDYHFISREDFQDMLALGKMLESDNFNGNWYGTSLEEFNNCDIMIMTPDGIKHAERVRSVCFIIHVFAPHATTMDRLAARFKVKEKKDMAVVHERINADNQQFKGFKDFDIEVDSTLPLNLMMAQIKKYSAQFS